MSSVKVVRYAEYKDSGIVLLGVFPKHWIFCKLKDIAFYQEGPGIMADDFHDKGIPLIRISGMKGNVVSLDGCNFLDPVKVKRKWSHFQLRQGELLVSASATTGIAAKVSEEIVGAIPYTGLIKFKPRKKLNLEYLQYFLTANIFTDQIDLQKSGTTIQHYGPTHLGRVLAVLAPWGEQTAIAAYLDTKTELIDRQIDLLSQKVTQYVKLKQSLINETVTRGLDKSVRMKDSGVNWIGEIPKHWEMKPIRNILENRLDKNVGNTEEKYLSLVAGIGVIPYAEKGNVGNKKPEDLEKCKMVFEGDFVLNSMNFGIGSFGISRYNGVCSSVYIVMRPKRISNGEFLHRIFQVKPFQKLMSSYGKGIMEIRMAIKWENLKNQALKNVEVQEGYDKARRSYELAEKVRKMKPFYLSEFEI